MGSDYSCAGLNFDFLHILLSGGGEELNMRKWKNTSTLNKIRILHHMTCIPKRF